MRQALRFNEYRLKTDMTEKGWNVMELARMSGVSHMTIRRFLEGGAQTPRVGKKLADALGYPVARYLEKGQG